MMVHLKDVIWVCLVILGIISAIAGGNWESWIAASFVVILLKNRRN